MAVALEFLRLGLNVLDPGYTLYCDIQQRTNLEIIALVEGLGVDFAIPARMLHSPSPADVQALLSTSPARRAPSPRPAVFATCARWVVTVSTHRLSIIGPTRVALAQVD